MGLHNKYTKVKLDVITHYTPSSPIKAITPNKSKILATIQTNPPHKMMQREGWLQ